MKPKTKKSESKSKLAKVKRVTLKPQAPQKPPLGVKLTGCVAFMGRDYGVEDVFRPFLWTDEGFSKLEPGWNDKISSFKVYSGKWRFYYDKDLQDPAPGVYGPGDYKWVEDWKIDNDRISSFENLERPSISP